MGVTELSEMMGTNPNLAHRCWRVWVCGKRPWVRGAWTCSASVAGGCRTWRGMAAATVAAAAIAAAKAAAPAAGPRPPNPPPRPSRKDPATSRVATKSPLPPQGHQGKAKAKAKPQAKGKGKAKPPPPKPQPPPCKKGAGTPIGMCRVWGTPGMSLGRRGAMGGPSAK